MTVEVGLWRLGEKPEKVRFVPIPKEEKLEDILAADLSILVQPKTPEPGAAPACAGEFIKG